ncbi:MAG: PASTA domain-containing protein [Geminicoccaceae bacterium]
MVGVLNSSDANPATESKKPPAQAPSPSTHSSHRAVPKPKPQRADVPVLAGMTLGAARAELHRDHLHAGYIVRRPSAAQPGTVLSQRVRRGKHVPWHSSVPLVIAVPLPRVPSVTGRTSSAAIQALRTAGFQTHTIRRTTTSGTEGLVLSQSPSSGRPARPHTVVTIVVAHVVRPVAPKPTQSADCTPGYSPCLAPAYDYDCAGGSGDGPKYVYGVEHVTGSDPYDLDADGDGYGCE